MGGGGLSKGAVAAADKAGGGGGGGGGGAAEAAADAGAKQKRRSPMKSQSHRSILAKVFLIMVAVALAAVLQAAPDREEGYGHIAVHRKAIQHAEGGGGFFDSGRGSFDVAALKEILGTGSDDIISSEDDSCGQEPSYRLRCQSEGKDRGRSRPQE